jgi:hypothetical protein
MLNLKLRSFIYQISSGNFKFLCDNLSKSNGQYFDLHMN